MPNSKPLKNRDLSDQKPQQVIGLLNSSPLGVVLNTRLLREHREKAGIKIGDGMSVNLYAYIAWLFFHRNMMLGRISEEALMQRGTRPLEDYKGRPSWFREEMRILDDGTFWGDVAEPWQRKMEAALDRTDEYRFAYVQLPRGHDKTGSMAFRALYDVCYGPANSTIYIFACDVDQAKVVVDFLRTDIYRNPRLRSGLTVGRREVTNNRTHSRIQVESSDAPSAYGLKPYRIYIDELHAWRRTTTNELWDALMTSTAKIDQCRVVITTNAGWDFNSVCRKVYDKSQDNPNWYHYAPDGWLATWSIELRDKMIDGMLEGESSPSYDRLILNRWVRDIDTFVRPQCVDGCCCLESPPLPSGGPIAIGVDLGLTHDLSAVAVVERNENTFSLLDMEVWKGTPKEPVQIGAVEEYLRTLCGRYPGSTIILDPYEMQHYYQAMLAVHDVEKFNFNAHKTQMSRILQRVVTEMRLHWWPNAGHLLHRGGKETTLATEMKALVTKKTSFGIQIDHEQSDTDDRTIAMGMAVWYLTQEEIIDAPELLTVHRGGATDGWMPVMGQEPFLTGVM